MRIEIASAADALRHLPHLNALLIDAVSSGASIGWLPPLSTADAERYWRDRSADVGEGSRVLLLAWEEERLVGSAQLGLEQRENGQHRAEVQKVMVHSAYRRRGIGRQLMQALEDCAAQRHRSLLFLDTSEDDPAELLYRQSGYVQCGKIPNYVRTAQGNLQATVFYAKILS